METEVQKNFKVLYIAGSGRSGSTLLSRLLGEIEGFINAGEAARYLFARYKPRDLPCGCGKSVLDCPFWEDIVSVVPSHETKKLAKKYMRIRFYPFLFLFFKSRKFSNHLKKIGKELGSLYSQIASKTNGKVIVDSSKSPDFAYLLNKNEKLDLYIVHVVKDPRGVASSWSKTKAYLHPQSVIRTGAGWLVQNSIIEFLRLRKIQYKRIIFEDFIANPKRTLEEILTFIKSGQMDLSFLQATKASIRSQHNLASNPDKLSETQEISIKPRRWDLPLYKNILVSVVTFPLLVKYYLFPRLSRKNINTNK
jgi:hypothetical protein